jgi:hypothetical protein
VGDSAPSRSLTVTASVLVHRPVEAVWDFTQDFSRRAEWDASVLQATVLEREPLPRVRIRGAGGLRCVLRYRSFDRPRRTSVSLEEVSSPLIQAGGGSWSYEAREDGTLWTQTNSLTLRPGWWRRLLAPLVRRGLEVATRRAMHRAQALLEAPA